LEILVPLNRVREADVVVVGAGFAGLAAARALVA
jgi:cation diffusion facilitator CzcD-associated flavoprotein CzcO